MTKLRIVTEEEDNISFPDNSLVIYLRVMGSDTYKDLSFLKSYELILEEYGDREVLLRCKHRASGDHKKQALSLFYAALEIHLHSPFSKSFIYQVNSMRELLQSNFSSENSLLKTWHASLAPLSIDGHVTSYLKEVDLEVGFSDHEIHHVDAKTLQHIYYGMSNQVSRKAA